MPINLLLSNKDLKGTDFHGLVRSQDTSLCLDPVIQGVTKGEHNRANNAKDINDDESVQ